MFVIIKFALILFITGIIFLHAIQLNNDGRLIRTKRIAYGYNVTIKQFPFFVSLITKQLSHKHMFPAQLQFCGGTIISKNWIISVASCFDHIYQYQLKLSDWFVRSGTSNWNATQKKSKFLRDHDVENCVIDFAFLRNRDSNHNVALVKVKQPFGYPTTPIFIAGSLYELKPNVSYVTVGFGESENYITSYQLKGVKVNLFNTMKCLALYYNIADRPISFYNMTCAKSPNDKESICEGDYGGPLIDYDHGTPVLIGISIIGPVDCGSRSELPGVYRITNNITVGDMCRFYNTGAKFYNNK